jgi:hypothetical protein
LLGLVPLAAQLEQAPRHPHGLAGLAAVEAVLDQFLAPVEGEAVAADVRGRPALLARGQVQGKLVRLVDHYRRHGHDRTISNIRST